MRRYRARHFVPIPPRDCLRCGAPVERNSRRALYCSRSCAVVQGNQRINADHRSRIALHKGASGCVVCGLREPSYVLDLHHLDAAGKWRAFGGSLTHKWERLEAELAKCVVLCANHHRMVEAGDVAL